LYLKMAEVLLLVPEVLLLVPKSHDFNAVYGKFGTELKLLGVSTR